MKVDATLRVPGAVLGAVDPFGTKAWVVGQNDRLYFDGRLVGEVLSLRPNGERVYEAGNPVPVDFITRETEIDCILELA